MQIRVYEENGASVIAPCGKIDYVTVGEFEDKINELGAQTDSLTLDMNDVEYASSAALFWAEDIYLAVTSVLTAIMIIMSHNPRNQKVAALTFILFPLIEYALMGGKFGNAAQYGMVLMSLIIMYCIIFIEKSKMLASTQTDLLIASKIQADALPPTVPDFEDFPQIILRGSMNTAKEVGGDFYDYFPIDENRICFLIADVSGKGTPAALFMMTSKTMIKDYALTKDTTSEIFTAVNARLCEHNDEGMFAEGVPRFDDITMVVLTIKE